MFENKNKINSIKISNGNIIKIKMGQVVQRIRNKIRNTVVRCTAVHVQSQNNALFNLSLFLLGTGGAYRTNRTGDNRDS